MFFFFSKVLLLFILPFTYISGFLIAALIVKNPKRKKKYFLISGVLLLIFSNPFLYNRFVHYWDTQPVPLKSSPYSCVIVLGGFSGADKNGDGFFNTAADRFIQGLKLYTEGKATHILISGGNGNLIPGPYRESDWVRKQLMLFRVPDSSIIVENRSRNTLENAAFSKVLLQEKHLQPPYLLVTSAFHMRRSIGIFKKEKMEITPYPCNYLAGNNDWSFGEFVPDPGPLSGWNVYIKEVIGTMVNYFK